MSTCNKMLQGNKIVSVHISEVFLCQLCSYTKYNVTSALRSLWLSLNTFVSVQWPPGGSGSSSMLPPSGSVKETGNFLKKGLEFLESDFIYIRKKN